MSFKPDSKGQRQTKLDPNGPEEAPALQVRGPHSGKGGSQLPGSPETVGETTGPHSSIARRRTLPAT